MRTLNDICIGERVEKVFLITEEIVKKYAEISYDYNPIHLNETYAANTRFKKRIAHGMLTGGYISSVIGNLLPGEGSIYLSQEMNFLKPVYYEDTVKVVVEILDIDYQRNIIKLQTNCYNQKGDQVIEGKANVLFSETL